MLYYIVPDEEIWAETDEIQIYEITTNTGCLMQVTSGDGSQGTILRILSTDPLDFLNPQYQPGRSVSLKHI